MSYTSDIWLYPLQDWCKMVNEMSDFMSTGQMGNSIFRPVLYELNVSCWTEFNWRAQNQSDLEPTNVELTSLICMGILLQHVSRTAESLKKF